MKSKALAVGLFIFAALITFCLPAHATVFDLALSGTVSNAGSGSGPGYVYRYLWLSGLDSNPITVQLGDTINATVTLDAPYTIPASGTSTSFAFYLQGSSFPTENTGVHGTISLFSGGTSGTNLLSIGPEDCTTSSQLALSFAFPTTASITFDSFTADLIVTTLGQPATLDGAQFTYFLFSPSTPVPVPGALLLFGPGLVGLAAIRRRFKK